METIDCVYCGKFALKRWKESVEESVTHLYNLINTPIMYMGNIRQLIIVPKI